MCCDWLSLSRKVKSTLKIFIMALEMGEKFLYVSDNLDLVLIWEIHVGNLHMLIM